MTESQRRATNQLMDSTPGICNNMQVSPCVAGSSQPFESRDDWRWDNPAILQVLVAAGLAPAMPLHTLACIKTCLGSRLVNASKPAAIPRWSVMATGLLCSVLHSLARAQSRSHAAQGGGSALRGDQPEWARAWVLRAPVAVGAVRGSSPSTRGWQRG
jgi:hypothetical protein